MATLQILSRDSVENVSKLFTLLIKRVSSGHITTLVLLIENALKMSVWKILVILQPTTVKLHVVWCTLIIFMFETEPLILWSLKHRFQFQPLKVSPVLTCTEQFSIKPNVKFQYLNFYSLFWSQTSNYSI